MTMSDDQIDFIQRQWSAERPDLDLTGSGVVLRILVLAKHLERSVQQELSAFDLELWEFDVLATLRRFGEPYQLSASQLARSVMLSCAAMTNRIDRLQKKGFVCRLPDPNDRRGVLIKLTDKGEAIIDEAIAARMNQAARQVASLSDEERTLLEPLLRKMLLSIAPKC